MKKLLVIVFFITVDHLFGQNKIDRYEYWFDNDYPGRVTISISPVIDFSLNTTFSTTSLQSGLHVLHFRCHDTNGAWSTTMSRFFQKIPGPLTTVSEIVGYEYWFDNDFAGRMFIAVSPQQSTNISSLLSASALPEGLHVIHTRFRESNGMWSSVLSTFFQRAPSSVTATAQIEKYQYWFDADFASAVTNTVGPAQQVVMSTTISAASLAAGIHVLHSRFCDNNGIWSDVYSQFFQRSPANATVSNTITAYQYWIDNNFQNTVSVSLSPQQDITILSAINMNAINDGIHVIHFRFHDLSGIWSSVYSQFFLKTQPFINNPEIVAYRYWFDRNEAAMISQSITAGEQYNMNGLISMVTIPRGVHTIHFQFADSTGKWSSSITDTLTKLSRPVAIFDASDTIFCDSGTVFFNNQSIDGDFYLWNFGDLGTSTQQNPAHSYNAPGLYSVSLTVTDTSANDSTWIRNSYVRVYATPSPIISSSGNDSICNGQTITLTADTGATYSWNTSASSGSIMVANSGDYWLDISNANNASCSVRSDTVHIEVMSLPTVNLGTDTNICQGSQLTLNAFNTGATYNWNTGASSSSLVVNSANTYWVSVTSSFGCQASDTILIGVDPLPVSAFTYSLSNLTATFTNGSSASSAYDWNFGDAVHSTQPAPIHTYSGAGTYTVTLIAFNACGSDTSTQVVIINGIESFLSGDPLMDIYPNPVTDVMNVRFAIPEDAVMHMVLTDVAGQIVLPVIEQEVRGGFVNTMQIPVGILANGSYFISMEVNGQRSTRKIVITH